MVSQKHSSGTALSAQAAESSVVIPDRGVSQQRARKQRLTDLSSACCRQAVVTLLTGDLGFLDGVCRGDTGTGEALQGQWLPLPKQPGQVLGRPRTSSGPPTAPSPSPAQCAPSRGMVTVHG